MGDGSVVVDDELVAPYVGAWIETRSSTKSFFPNGVAPYVGAWIETHHTQRNLKNFDVAPYVGAWIETGDSKI